MGKLLEKNESKSLQGGDGAQTTLDENKSDQRPDVAPSPSVAVAPRPAQAEIRLDESKAVACYANFCRVTGTPEELIVDFGLNSQPMGVPSGPIPVTQRLVVNYYTAKRMLAALQMSIQRHEAAFGALETDVQRRLLPNALRQHAQSGP